MIVYIVYYSVQCLYFCVYNTRCSEVCLIEQAARDGFGVWNTLGVGLQDIMVYRQIHRKELNKHGNIQRIGFDRFHCI